MRNYGTVEKSTNEVGMKLTPVMEQYLACKNEYPDCMVLFQLGDFFEIFGQDAKDAAHLLGITLTKRSHGHEDGFQKLPMAGIPVRSLDVYVSRLIRQNIKVAICEQVESPQTAKKQKRIVRRQVTQVLTPGTAIEQDSYFQGQNNFLMAITELKEDFFGVAWFDITTGEFFCSITKEADLMSEIMRVNPREIIISDNMAQNKQFSQMQDFFVTVWPISTYEDGLQRLESHFNDDEVDFKLSPREIEACATIMEYVFHTQKSLEPRFNFPEQHDPIETMSIDAATFKSLELTKNWSSMSRTGSLIHTIDKTVTSQGGRELLKRLSNPLTNIHKINHRLDNVDGLVHDFQLIQQIQNELKEFHDCERLVQKINLGKVKPQQLLQLSDSIYACKKILTLLKNSTVNSKSQSQIECNLTSELISLGREIFSAIDIELSDCCIIPGYSKIIDRHRSKNYESIVKELQSKYKRATNVATLKVKKTNHLGYHIQVPVGKKLGEPFKLISTLKSYARYITPELTEIQYSFENAQDTILEEEANILEGFRDKILKNEQNIRNLSTVLAHLDVYASLALLAREYNLCRPTLTEGLEFDIKNGRHIVVEASQQKLGLTFCSNDCYMDEKNIYLLTGPNMGGKSTYLRTNAIIVLLAQMGSFVPADKATIGVVDRIFSRVGAHDSLLSDQSTFMVEMLETANILHSATPRSFVICDELGRGTSTRDGLSIAHAVLEYLHDRIQCRTLFATHYRELCDRMKAKPRIALYAFTTLEEKNRVMFSYKIAKGIASDSYGIQVAKLAGLPTPILRRAKELSETYEK